MVAARGAENRPPGASLLILVALCDEAASQLPELFAASHGVRGWSDHAALARELLGDDPVKIVDALKAAIGAGALLTDLSQSLAYAAALRVARFGNANEHGDWETAHHVFTYSNALDQMLRRVGTDNSDGHVSAVRGILHGAMALYLTRYLNVPPARIPGETASNSMTCLTTLRRSAQHCWTLSTGSDRSILWDGWWHGTSSSAIRPTG